EHRHAARVRVQVGAGGDTQPALHGGCQVGEDVAEHVVGDHDVEAAGVLQQVDTRRVDVDVGGPHAGVRRGDVVEDALPQVARVVEHVRLVHEGHVPAAIGPLGAPEGERDAPFDAAAGVDRLLDRHFLGRAPPVE